MTPANEAGKTFAVWNDGGGWAMNIYGCTGNTVVQTLYIMAAVRGNHRVEWKSGAGPLVFENSTGADEQLWTLVPDGNANVLLVNDYSGLAASVTTTSAGETVVQKTPTGGTGQQWFSQGAPVNVVAAAGYNQVSLSWSLSGATSYSIGRASSSIGTYTTIASGLTSFNYTYTGLTNDATYYYEISATTTLGQGPGSIPGQCDAINTRSFANVVQGGCDYGIGERSVGDDVEGFEWQRV